MKTFFALTTVALLALAGCGGAEIRGDAYVEAPSLEYVSPGVQVVADYDYPVFYADDFYWMYSGGIWFRSYYFDRGWGRAAYVPPIVGRIDRPGRFAHYHGRGYAYNHGHVTRAYPRPVMRANRTPAHVSAPHVAAPHHH